jgi:hypothetical protein
MKRCTHLATFLASLARVIGPGGLRKSLVGICRLHWRYPGHCKGSQYQEIGGRARTNLEADGNAGPTTLKDGDITVSEALHPRMKGITQGDPAFVWAGHPEKDGGVKLDLLDVTPPVAVCMGLVHLLRHEGPRDSSNREGQRLSKEVLLLPVSVDASSRFLEASSTGVHPQPRGRDLPEGRH